VKVHPIGIPAHGDGRISAAKSITMLRTRLEKYLLPRISEELTEDELVSLVDALPQREATHAMTRVFSIIHAHGIMEQRVQSHDLEVCTSFSPDQ
jgi:hypothetical protein